MVVEPTTASSPAPPEAASMEPAKDGSGEQDVLAEKRTGLINLNDEESFPSLGSGSSKRPPTQPAKPSYTTTASSSGKANASGALGPRMGAKSASSESIGSQAKSQFVQDVVHIPPNSQVRRSGFGKNSSSEVVKGIIARTKTELEMSTAGKTGVLTVVIRGKPDDVKRARREVMSHFCVQTTETITVPVMARPFIVGSGGKNLKDIISRSGCKIDMPRPKEEEIQDEDAEQNITITGDFEGVQLAKKEIEAIVANRIARLASKVTIERSYHPFVAQRLPQLQEEFNVKIHIPPTLQQSKEEDIRVSGDRESVRRVIERIQTLYEDLRATTRTLIVAVRKRTHRYIIGPKGANLQEIMAQTGCAVELPAVDDPSDQITIRGPESQLVNALGLVMEKSKSVVFEDVPLTFLAPGCDSQLMVRYLLIKQRAQLRALEQEHNVSIIPPTLPEESTPTATLLKNGPLTFEIQGKTSAEASQAKDALVTMLKQLSEQNYYAVGKVRKDLVKFVIGKGGSHINKFVRSSEWNGKLVDIATGLYGNDEYSPDGDEDEDEQDELIVIVKRLEFKNQKEADAFVKNVIEHLVSDASKIAELETKTITVEQKYHPRLKGRKGENSILKEVTSEFNVIVRLPPGPSKNVDGSQEQLESRKCSVETANATGSSAVADLVVIKGKKEDVENCAKKLLEIVGLWKHAEVMNSFCETVEVSKGLAKRLVGVSSGMATSGGIAWLVKAIKEAVENSQREHARVEERDLNARDLNLRVEVSSASSKTATNTDSSTDTISIHGPQKIVDMAKGLMTEKAKVVANTVMITVDLVEVAALRDPSLRGLLAKEGEELRRRIVRRLIGKDAKNKKKVEEKYNVRVWFKDGRKQEIKSEAEEGEIVEEAPVSVETNVKEGVVDIKGCKDDVEKARKELVDAAEHEMLYSFNVTMQVPKHVINSIIGKGGANIAKVKSENNVRVTFLDEGVEDPNALVDVVIDGPSKGVEKAKESISAVVDEIVNTVTEELDVPHAVHKHIIGPNGSHIKAILDKFEGREKVNVQFPSLNSEDSTLLLKGHRSILPKLKAEVMKIVDEYNRMEEAKAAASAVSKEITLPKSDIPRLIGRGGETLRQLRSRFNVSINVGPEEDVEESAPVKVTVAGVDEKTVDECIAEIRAKERLRETIALPSHIAKFLFDDDVVISHAMTDIVEKTLNRIRKQHEARMNLIVKKVQDLAQVQVVGDRASVEKAVVDINEAIAEVPSDDVFETIPIEDHLRRHIIGRGGFNIIKLREDTGCAVDVIKKEANKKLLSDVVVLKGSKDNIAKARRRIERIISDQKRFDQERTAAESARQQPARIDEAFGSSSNSHNMSASFTSSASANEGTETVSSGSKYPPGYSGTIKNKRLNKSVEEVQYVSASPVTARYESKQNSAGEWLTVGKKGVEPSKDSADKKKNKKKNQSAADQSLAAENVSGSSAAQQDSWATATDDWATPIETMHETQVIPPQNKTHKQEQQHHTHQERPQSKKQSNHTPSSKDSVSQQTDSKTKSPAKSTENKPQRQPVWEPEPASEEEWQTVGSTSTVKKMKAQRAAASLTDNVAVVGASGEKKNKKKKKKTKTDGMNTTSSSVMPGDDDEE